MQIVIPPSTSKFKVKIFISADFARPCVWYNTLEPYISDYPQLNLTVYATILCTQKNSFLGRDVNHSDCRASTLKRLYQTSCHGKGLAEACGSLSSASTKDKKKSTGWKTNPNPSLSNIVQNRRVGEGTFCQPLVHTGVKEEEVSLKQIHRERKVLSHYHCMWQEEQGEKGDNEVRGGGGEERWCSYKYDK